MTEDQGTPAAGITFVKESEPQCRAHAYQPVFGREARPNAYERGLSMLEQAVCREPLASASSLRSRNTLIPEPDFSENRMVALICHDLRLPLTAILANAEFLAHSDINDMERAEFYQEIRWAIERMNELVSSLLECSRDRDTLRPTARNIVDTVERAVRMISVKQEFRNITIRHLHKGLGVGWFDSSRLERVLANLVLNACEAVSPDSGRIVITTTGNRSSLQIGVWDNGPGIPPAIQDSVFQLCVSYGKAEGSGLGLAIAKKIVEDHGGDISLDRSSGLGTLFKIAIPFAIPLGANAHMPPDPIHPHVLSGTLARSVQES